MIACAELADALALATEAAIVAWIFIRYSLSEGVRGLASSGD